MSRHVNMIDIFKRYGGRRDDEFEDKGNGRYETLCHKHQDSNPSLSLYENEDGWQYHCYACQAHGNNITLLKDLKIAKTNDQAYDVLAKDFGVKQQCDLESFSLQKGLNIDILKAHGWSDCKEGISIPYKDIQGNVTRTKYRLKIFGKENKFRYSKGEGPLIYNLHSVFTYTDSVLYITEGETDCMTLIQTGYPTIGIAGATSWKPEYIQYVARFKKIIVCIDNDDVGEKMLESISKDIPNKLYFKEPRKGFNDINDLHVLGAKKDSNVFKVMFDNQLDIPYSLNAFLDEARENKKIVKSKIAWGHISKLIDNPLDMEDFINELSDITKYGKRSLKEMITQQGAATKIEEGVFIRNGGLARMYDLKGEPVIRQLTNFTVETLYEIDNDGEIDRCVRLTNDQGRRSPVLKLLPSDLSNPQRFSEKCLSAGTFYVLSSHTEDHGMLARYIMNNAKETLRSPNYIGKIKDGWLFGNCGINNEGELIEPSEDGVINFGRVRYLPKSVILGDEGTSSLPQLKYKEKVEDGYLKTLLDSVLKCWGTMDALLGLGWTVSAIFSDVVYKEKRCFPYLFATGKRGSGKSTYLSILCQAFGITEWGTSIDTTTKVGMDRMLSYMSCLPKWYDDFKMSSKTIRSKHNIFLDTYNRANSEKGTRDSKFGLQSNKKRGLLMLTGEDAPSGDMNAVQDRCCILTFSANDREPEGEKERLNATKELAESFSSVSIDWFKASVQKKEQAKFMKILDTTMDQIKNEGVDMRKSLNYALCVAGFIYGFGDIVSDQELDKLIKWGKEKAVVQKQAVDSEHPEMEFIKDLGIMASLDSKNLFKLHQEIDYLVEQECKDTVLYFSIRDVYKKWSGYNKQHGLENEINEKSLKEYLSKEPFFVTGARKQLTSGRKRLCGIKLNMLLDDSTCFDMVNVFTCILEKESDY